MAALLVVPLLLVVGSSYAVEGCGGLHRPVAGSIVRLFAPTGAYSGHWGVDFGAKEGTPVRAAGAGVVTFAGSVAGMKSVTVHHGGGLRTSYSYLAGISVAPDEQVKAGRVLGATSLDHGSAALHFSVRLADRYLDPAPFLDCRARPPAPALWLLPAWWGGAGPAYPFGDAARHPGRNLRPTPSRPSRGRRRRLPAAPFGRGDLHARRSAVAESRSARLGRGAPVGYDQTRGSRRRLLRARRPGSPPGRLDLHHRYRCRLSR